MNRRRPRDTDLRRTRRAFSLIELVVVVVLLAVVTGLIVPRLLAVGAGATERIANESAELLAFAARRATLSATPVMVAAERDPPRLVVLSRVAAEPGLFDLGREVWRQDPLSPTVSLEEASVVSASIDGSATDPGTLRILFEAGGVRPAVDLTLADAGSEGFGERWTVRLSPLSDEPLVFSNTGLGAAGLPPASEDLDLSGRRDEAW